jgi:hypothetical protein
VLTNKRLRLADADGNQSVPHSRVSLADDPDGLDGVATDGATPLRVGNNVVLVNAADVRRSTGSTAGRHSTRRSSSPARTRSTNSPRPRAKS